MRYCSIDLLRSFAIVVMVLVHFTENLSGVQLVEPLTGVGWRLEGFGAPLFAFLLGLSYRLWLNGMLRRGKEDSLISRMTVRRGLFLFGLGFAFNILVWLPEDTFNWDVLTMLGTALLVLNLARRLPPSIPVFFCLVAFAISPVLRVISDYPAFWPDGYFDPDWTLSDLLIGFLATGYFPLFPWLIYPLAGFVTGTFLFPSGESSRASLRPVAILGGILATSGLTAVLLRAYAPGWLPTGVSSGWTMFPASPEYVLGTLGLALLLFTAGHHWIDRGNQLAGSPGLRTVAETFSRHSLTVYLLHHIAHLWPLWIYGASTGDEPTAVWGKAMTLPASILLAIVFLVLCYFFLRWLDRNEKPTAETWMRWLCDE